MTQIGREYQANKRQRMNNYNGNTCYNGNNNENGNQFSSNQAQIFQAQCFPYGGSVVYPMPHNMGTHMIPPPPPQYRSVKKFNQFQQHLQRDDNATQISVINTGGSIMGGRDKQASLRSCNKNRQVQNVFSKQRIGSSTEVYKPAPNTYATNEADTYYGTCCFGVNFIPITYTNHTSDVYPYSNSY